MKYFVKDWYKDIDKSKKIIQEYNDYYKTIEQQISVNVKNVFKNKHDTYIVKAYFQEKDYVMELEEKIWGKAYIIFKNATVKCNSNIKEEYWLYNEVYKNESKYEIHILFSKSDIIIMCDDAYISIKNKDYFKDLYIKEDYSIDLADNNKKDIANVVIDKELTCGYIMLNEWEKIIYSFIQIYIHINYYKYNSIDDTIERQYYNFSTQERKEKYRQLLSELEERLNKSIKVLERNNQIMESKELSIIISEFLGVYNNKDISLYNKNQLYVNLSNEISSDINNIYISIIEYINNNLCK